MSRKINFNYLNRDFHSLREDLINYTKIFYPNQYNDFSESSVGMMLLELNAYVGDMLSFHVDKTFNEMWIDSAKDRSSLFKIGKNLGYKPSGKKPSITLLDITIEIPPGGSANDFNEDYLIKLEPGFIARSTNGTVFEVLDEIDFEKHTSDITGVVNRFINPVYNDDNEIVAYRITKRVAAIAGETKVATLEITSENAIPFMKWNLDVDDDGITEVLNVIAKENRVPPTSLSEWSESGPYTVWHKVESLPQERVFVETSHSEGSEGYWRYVEKRFISEYDENGNMTLTFGGGIEDQSSYEDFLSNTDSLTVMALLNNDSLGEIPSPGMYLHCRYRSGGGESTNAPQGSITNVVSNSISYIPPAANLALVSQIVSNMTCINPIPAIGGRDHPTVHEIRHHAAHHYSAQDRCVTVNDYTSRISKLPPQYGTIFRSYAQADPESMNTRIHILTRDENGKLKNLGNSSIKANLASYLSKYKMLNDFVVIDDGRIINLAINFKIQVEFSYNKKEVLTNCIKVLKDYFDIKKWQMSDTIYISQVMELLRQQSGVVNVIDISFKNKVGGDYSKDILSSEKQNIDIAQATKSGEIDILPINNKIKAPLTGMFEIKYPEKDIRGSAI
jgi:hypothetical protein